MGCANSTPKEEEPKGYCGISGAPVLTKPMTMAVMMPMMRRMMNSKMSAGGDPKVELTMEEYKQKEWDAWHQPGKDWELYKRWRPYNVQDPNYENKAPRAGDPAPDGPVLSYKADSEPSTLLAETKKLADGKKVSFCGILFMAVTCPLGRTFAWHDLYKAVTKHGFPVLCVYTLEAHPYGSDGFHTGVNEKGPLAIDKQMPLAKDEGERRLGAEGAKKILESQLGGEEVTMVLDGMDDALEKAYEARPFRCYIINVDDGKVALHGGPCPLRVPAKLEAIQNFNSAA